MEECLSAEELLSMAEFNEKGDTEQLLAPDLTNLSQYWYRDDTIERLLDEVRHHMKHHPKSKVAICMAPTLYCRLFEADPDLAKNVYLLEYDKRFSVYDNFAFYDVHDPLGGGIMKLPAHAFDFILADPPFWLEDVLTKLFSTIDYLSVKKGAKETHRDEIELIEKCYSKIKSILFKLCF